MPLTDPSISRAWWKSAIVYQIYPYSFFDSNGDGIGDLNGILAKLDYLKDLGVDVLWLCPIYRSPHKDMGYDVSDYFDIDPRFGTLEDWDNLVKGVHERGMKILMDLVANHTSNEHPWFLEAKASKDSPKRDWYFWRPPKFRNGKIGHPPNNWASILQGPAWEYDQDTKEYYLHLFTRYQPDLNWNNPAVRKAMADVTRFWIDRGCDGFRMDAINAISKEDGLPDAEVTDHTQFYQSAAKHWANGPRVHEFIQELNREVLSHHDVMTVGEAAFTYEPDVIAEYVLPQNKELNQTFNFELNNIDAVPAVPLLSIDADPRDIRDVVHKWQTYKPEEGFWNALFLENHDTGRAISRFLDDSAHRALSAKLLATLLVTQAGTLYLYQGEEIGMKNFPRSWGIEEYKDVATQLQWNELKYKRQHETGMEDPYMKDVLDDLRLKARDHARIPVQWDATDKVGFTTGTPWMRAYVEDAREGWNVADESKDPESVFAFWKRAIQIRKSNDVLIYGEFKKLDLQNDSIFAYVRKLGNKTAWVAVNLWDEPVKLSLKTTEESGLLAHSADLDTSLLPQLALSNYSAASGPPGLTADPFDLRPYEARLYIQ